MVLRCSKAVGNSNELPLLKATHYADDLVLLAKEGKVLQDMIDKLIEIGRSYGMEMNVEKTKVMRISRQPFPVQIMIDQKGKGKAIPTGLEGPKGFQEVKTPRFS